MLATRKISFRADKKRWLYATAVIVGMLRVIAVQASEYPSRWPSLKETPTGKCASLTGVYQYYGESSDSKLMQEYGPPMIDGTVFHRPPARGRVVYVTHSKEKETVSFEVKGGDAS